MSPPVVVEETTVNESHSVTVPSGIRGELDIEPGDKLRWRLTDDTITVEVIQQRYGTFDSLEPVDTETDTDAVTLTESSASER